MFIVFSVLMMVLSPTIVLLIFWLLDLSVSDRGMSKSPSVRLDSSVSPGISISFSLTYFDAALLGTYMLILLHLLGELTPLSVCNVPFYQEYWQFSLVWNLFHLKLRLPLLLSFNSCKHGMSFSIHLLLTHLCLHIESEFLIDNIMLVLIFLIHS